MGRRSWLIAASVAVFLGPAVGPSRGIEPGEPVRDLSVLYVEQPIASTIAGPQTAPTLPGAWIQAPTGNDPRWPAERQVGKVSGAELVTMGAAAMEKSLRSELSRRDRGGLVAIDEIVTPRWTDDAARELGRALDQLGPDARRVIIYVGPGVVGAVGLIDPREPLPEPFASLLTTLRKAGVVYLETYHGDLSPFTPEEFARETTRWLERWSLGDPERLRLVLGPAVGTTQAEVWRRARATPAGRTLLANRPGAYGLRDVAEGTAWLSAYQAFRADPTSTPGGGDTPVPTGGGLSVRAAKGGVIVVFTRPGPAAVRLIPPTGGAGRIIKTVTGPTPDSGVLVPFSRSEAPGRHRVVVTAKGDGLRDEATIDITIAAGAVFLGRPVLRPAGARAVSIKVTSGARAVVRLVRASDGRSRVIGKLTGTGRAIVITLPTDTGPGAYRLLVTATLRGRRATNTLSLTVGGMPRQSRAGVSSPGNQR